MQSLFNKLVCLSAELTALGAKDVTDNMVVRTLLRSLDNSYDHVRMRIKERTDFATLKPADIIERLMTHDMEGSERREVNGSKGSHDLKAKASNDSS